MCCGAQGQPPISGSWGIGPEADKFGKENGRKEVKT